MELLVQRLDTLEKKLTQLESHFGGIETKLDLKSEVGLLPSGSDPSETECRLLQELKNKKFSFGRFVRVPSDYYSKPLIYRQSCLGAASTGQLCKTMVMENTKRLDDPSPTNYQYLMVILQYEKDRVHGEKLQSYLYGLNQKKIPRRHFNLRLAAEDATVDLTGFSYNSVTPVGSLTALPIIISHEIVRLPYSTFYLGAGEVDLKLELSTDEFTSKYSAEIVDCTY